jgi:hypothetical protein
MEEWFMKTKFARLALFLAAGIAVVQLAYADPGCSNRDLSGVYGMFATGTIVVAPAPVPTGPFVRVGRVTADGNGNISVHNTASYDGNIVTESYPATYTVSPDCGVDIKPIVPLPLGPGGAPVNVPFEFIGALAADGDQAAVVVCGVGAPCFAAPPGSVIRVLLNRQSNDSSHAQCTARDLSGAFQLDMAGTYVTGGPAPGPFARDGVLTFDGKGAFSGHAIANYSGFVIDAEALAGTYAVDPLCNVSISYALPAGTTHTWTGTLTNQSSAADLIVTETGVVVAGTLKAEKSAEGHE